MFTLICAPYMFCFKFWITIEVHLQLDFSNVKKKNYNFFSLFENGMNVILSQLVLDH